ncbi:hypothetical protein BJ138DRAFT_1156108 [Hygrophoropsis aurantiaca]|uniref:Uncharacterized protein n=1 Tax=Hygrophoropsis aurantiaca TaxID=72124 RepID=A0ACB8A6K9_9AGAM|nr:hypothetical protein BJ138DRAFT_1156108 [Hygrophoropsis aurantiaca]
MASLAIPALRHSYPSNNILHLNQRCQQPLIQRIKPRRLYSTLHFEQRRHAAKSCKDPQLQCRNLSNGGATLMFPQNHNEDPESHNELSDHEWEMRTGRAIYILQQTLPDFFRVGLVSGIDPDNTSFGSFGSSDAESVESIYSPNVRLVYTPPVALPSPFPRTLRVEGLPLYMASSVFVRHTMKALYSDLNVELRKLTVQSSPSSQPGGDIHQRTDHRREKRLFVALCVTGTTRVSGGRSQWQIDSTYTFSPISGFIHTHTINSIQPAPHQAAYDALRSSLSTIFGIGDVGPDVQPGNVRTCEARAQNSDHREDKSPRKD